MNKNLILRLVLFFSALTVSGQEIWSLQKCIEVALQNNIDIKINQLEISKAKKNYTHPLMDLFPSLNVNANHSYNFGSTINPNTNTRVSSDIQWDELYAGATSDLLNFRNLAQSKKQKINIEWAKANAQSIEQDYKLLVLEKYYDALFTQELLEIQEKQLENAVFNRNRIQKEVEIGKKPQSDWYDIQFSFSQEQKNLISTQQLLEIQKMILFQVLQIDLQKTDSIVLQENLTRENTSVTFNNPKIQTADLTLKLTKQDERILKSYNLPQLSGFYGFSTFYSTPINQTGVTVPSLNKQIGDNKNQSLGLQLKIPVFNGFRNRNTIQSAKIETEKMKLNVAQESLKIVQQISIEEKKYQQYLALIPELDNSLNFAEKAFKTNQSKFESGKIEAVIFISIKNQLLNTQYEKLKNKLQLQLTQLKINLIKTNEL